MRLLLPIFLIGGCTATFTNDFTSYPAGSQQCLYRAASDSQCVADTSAQMNYCLCRNNGNFIYAAARCVAQQSPSDLKTVYAVMASNCAGTGTTIVASEDAFLAQAAAATAGSAAAATASSTGLAATETQTSKQVATQTSAPAATRTSTELATQKSTQPAAQTSTQPAGQTANDSPENTAAPSGDSLSTVVKIGIGVGIGFGMAGCLVGAFFFYLYRRRGKQDRDFGQAQKLESGESSGSLTEAKGSRASLAPSVTPIPQAYPAELSAMEPVELPAGPYPISELPAPSRPVEMPLESPRLGVSEPFGWQDRSLSEYADDATPQDGQFPHYMPSPMSGYSSPYATFASTVSVTSLALSAQHEEPERRAP
ncbi:hypothetical protein GQ53DRAFT_750063 [Thozetella sp. PMI_491]|nr:hypothetical protein GQ53DRAFT_750063 [Thozetella sp. PMI_491]